METVFVRIPVNGGELGTMTRCNPIYVTNGIWISTEPLCIEGIPIKLDFDTARQITTALGGGLPELWMMDYIIKAISNRNDFDNFEGFSDDEEDDGLNGKFLKNIWLQNGKMYTGSIIEPGEATWPNGEFNYVYPIFWKEQED